MYVISELLVGFSILSSSPSPSRRGLKLQSLLLSLQVFCCLCMQTQFGAWQCCSACCITLYCMQLNLHGAVRNPQVLTRSS